MPVEAVATPTGTTTMEITVSKFELLRELTATDLDLSLRTACAARVKKEGSCTVPARKLHDYVKLLPDADITIRLLENHWVSIRCGRSNTKMFGMARSNFPSLPPFPTAGAVKIPAAALRAMIAKTTFAVANE